MSKQFYITTPIYYANAKVQFGNMYTALIADVYARTYRLLGYDVVFGTGTDENGQKMLQVAQSQGKDVMTFLDEIVAIDQQVMQVCQISYTDFIRTSEPRHHRLVQYILQKTYENADIYQWEYQGLYCVGCEAFKKESDLIRISHDKGGADEGSGGFVLVCPDHLTPPEQIQEKNRFFRLSKYQEKLTQYFAQHPDFLVPQYRYNEVLSFVQSGLEDFSISRQGSTFGIPIPRDPDSITYIRYDALLNYLTMMVESRDESGTPIFKSHASVMHHTLGKDISRFHAVYRVAMLMAAGLEEYLPRQEYIGWFFTVNGQKMSKSLGNMIYADDLCQQTDRDAVMLYMLYDIAQGADGDFSELRFGEMYQTMLIGWRGNLVNRVITMSAKNTITTASYNDHTAAILDDLITQLNLQDNPFIKMIQHWRDNTYRTQMLSQATLQSVVRSRYELVQLGNKLMDTLTPWIKLKNPDTHEQGLSDLSFLVWYISKVAIVSSPFLVNGRSRFSDMIGNDQIASISTTDITAQIQDIFDTKSFEVNMTPTIMYRPQDA